MTNQSHITNQSQTQDFYSDSVLQTYIQSPSQSRLRFSIILWSKPQDHTCTTNWQVLCQSVHKLSKTRKFLSFEIKHNLNYKPWCECERESKVAYRFTLRVSSQVLNWVKKESKGREFCSWEKFWKFNVKKNQLKSCKKWGEGLYL